MKTNLSISILCVLPKALGLEMEEILPASAGYSCRQAEAAHLPAIRLTDLQFWSALPLETADVVFLSLPAATISELCEMPEGIEAFRQVRNSLPGEGAAVVGVLSDCRPGDIVQAHLLGLEGLLAHPFEGETVRRVVEQALVKNQQRRKQIIRQDKVRQLCRDLNHKRRQLRHKVDILCRDLVHSNQFLTHSVQELQRLCDFQNGLAGEFDLGYMLHKALKMIQHQIPESSTAFYLAAEKRFEAHLSGLWYDRADDIEELEKLFSETLVRTVSARQRRWLIPEAERCAELTGKQKKLLAGLSLLALPVLVEGELLGILIVYRHAREPLREGDMQRLEMYVPPLGRAVRSTYILQTHIGSL
ncbi:MAG: hypothetical protein BWY71_00635 [Planctomycetes bacterium ADurb.Bin412]|nr:MAG: hypothetical protein BWY71_00635 [Planctomycetes bacterium ADurb.Bin412]